MKSCFFFALLLSVTAVVPSQARRGFPAQLPSQTSSAQKPTLDVASIPLSFEPNRGQTAAEVQWVARGSQYALFLAGPDAVLELNATTPPKTGEAPALSGAALRMNLAGAQRAQPSLGEQPLPGKANYFTGNDSAKWLREVPTFGRVRLRGVYAGIDLVYYGRQGRLEYDFVVAPGADPAAIRLAFAGATAALAPNGDLTLPVNGTKTVVRFDKPVVYQMRDGLRQPVSGDFQIGQNRQVSFRLGAYDRTRELVIDPTLLFDGVIATGNQQTVPTSMAVDAAGEIFLTGYTNDLTFPVTTGAYQTTCPGFAANGFGPTRCGPSSAPSAFVTKISADGTSLVYSTYLHGGGGYESGQSIALDAAGDAYILGSTTSTDFPVTSDAYSKYCQPFYSTYPQKTSQCNNFYNGGGTEYTINGPNLFIAKLNPTGTALLYSTFFGGSASVYPVGLALDGANNIFFASSVNPGYSADNAYPSNTQIPFPVTASAYQTVGTNTVEAAVSELSADGHTLLYSTLLGSLTAGSQPDYPQAFAVGQGGLAFVGGFTSSSTFPTTAGAIKPSCPLATNNASYCFTTQGFVTALDTTKSGNASLVYSTYLGGDAAQGTNIPEQEVYGLAADGNNNLFVTGYTYARDYPTTAGVYQPTCIAAGGLGGSDCSTAFLSKINPSGSALVWSTFLGGQTARGTAGSTGNAIALDTRGRVYLYGLSNDGGGDFPQVNPLEPYSSGNKVFLATFSADATQLLFSTRFSGTNTNTLSAAPIANGIAVDSAGSVYFAGYTNDGGSFGTTSGTYATPATNGFNRAFFGKISAVLPASATTLTVAPAQANAGQNVLFSVQVAGSNQTTPIPTGTVTLTNTGVTPAVTLGTITLGDTGAGTFSTSALPVGAYSITATYGGDATYDTSVSPPQPLTVVASPTTTTLTASAASINTGQAETLTATILGGATPILTGTVIFSDQNGLLGTVPVTPTTSGGSAALTLTALSVGAHQITARYSGDANYTPSISPAQTVTVSIPTTTTLTISSASITAGQAETLSAIILGSATPAPGGTVTFADQNGPLGSVPVTATSTGASAALTLTTLSAGSHRITARYSGDTTYLTSTSAAQTVLVMAVTTATLSVSAASLPATQPEVLTATILGSATSSPTGTVTFSDQSGALGSATVSPGASAASAVLTLTSLSVGTHQITARYGGDANNAGSASTPQTVLVSLAPQTITFPPIPNHVVGDSAFAPAATSSSGLAVTYNVISGPASVAASLVTLTGAAGTVILQASQAGNATYAAATPVTQSFTVAAISPPVLLSLSPAGAAAGSASAPITLTGTNFTTADIVQGNGASLPTTFVNASTLTAVIPSGLLATAGTDQITVFDPVGKIASVALPFTVSPVPAIVLTGPSVVSPGQQPTLTFQLVNPYPVAIAGVLTLTFTPGASAPVNDPAVQFSTGGRMIAFTIPALSTVTPAVQLQSGTVAGTATITLVVTANGIVVTPANVAPVVITIPPTVPAISTALVNRSGNALSVVIRGFSNTRELTTAIFHFAAAPGSTVNTPDITAPVTPAFAAWYASTASAQFGSTFTYTQNFTLDADAGTIGSVTVTLVNSVGSSVLVSAQ